MTEKKTTKRIWDSGDYADQRVYPTRIEPGTYFVWSDTIMVAQDGGAVVSRSGGSVSGGLEVARLEEGNEPCDDCCELGEACEEHAGEIEERAALIVRAVNLHPVLVDALKLAQRWLANCMPIVELDGPKPLPVIAEALALAEKVEEAA